MNPLGDKPRHVPGGAEGTTPVTTAFAQKIDEGKNVLRRKVEMTTGKEMASPRRYSQGSKSEENRPEVLKKLQVKGKTSLSFQRKLTSFHTRYVGSLAQGTIHCAPSK